MAPIDQTNKLGERGEPCEGCGAPLAADQRYCLNCGRRRGGPRVAYLEALFAAPQAAAAAPAGSPSGRRDYGPLAAVGGIMVLGLMLLVGVLIGRGDNEPTTAAAPAPIVQVGDTDGGDDTTASADTSSKDSAADSTKTAKDDAASGGGEKKDSDLTGGGGSGTTEDPVQASTADLEALESASGENYSDASENLPDTIATPGEAPPVDNEAPGGGSSGTTIK